MLQTWQTHQKRQLMTTVTLYLWVLIQGRSPSWKQRCLWGRRGAGLWPSRGEA